MNARRNFENDKSVTPKIAVCEKFDCYSCRLKDVSSKTLWLLLVCRGRLVGYVCGRWLKGFELLMLATAWPLEGKNQVAENVQNNFAIPQAFSKQLERSLGGVAIATSGCDTVFFGD